MLSSRREDGYHNIETCFYPVPWCDVLEAIPKRFSLDHTGLPIAGTGNLLRTVLRHVEGRVWPAASKNAPAQIIPGRRAGQVGTDAAFTLKSLMPCSP